MNILICPIRSKRLAPFLLACLLLAACAGTSRSPAPISQPDSSSPPITQPSISNSPSTTPIQENSPPSILIRNKTASSILDAIVKFRTQKGMKLTSREPRRVEFSLPIPHSAPPAEALMIYSLSPASDGQRLSAQVFQQIRLGNKKQTSDITTNYRDQLEDELKTYTR